MTARNDEARALQRLIDSQYKDNRKISKIDFLVAVESYDVCDDLLEICRQVPPGSYIRSRLIDQLNSSIVGHGWEQIFGTLE